MPAGKRHRQDVEASLMVWSTMLEALIYAFTRKVTGMGPRRRMEAKTKLFVFHNDIF